MLINRQYQLHPRTGTWVAPAMFGPFKREPVFQGEDRIVMWACSVTAVLILAMAISGWL